MAQNPILTFEMENGGIMKAELYPEVAPNTVNSFIYLAVVISMNLGVMNLLPLPALDGGRLIFLIIEGIRRKPVKPEVEGYVHFAGIVVLMLFMVFICVKDVIGLFG